jgi:hypothetical protein
MDTMAADREAMRRRAKLGWTLIAAGFAVVGLVFIAAHGLGLAEGSPAFSVLVVLGYGGCIVAVIGALLIIMFHLFDRSYPPGQSSK